MGTVNSSLENSEASLSLLSQSAVSNSSDKQTVFCKCFRRNNVEDNDLTIEPYLKWKKYMVNLLNHRYKIHPWSQMILQELYNQEIKGINYASQLQFKLCEQLDYNNKQIKIPKFLNSVISDLRCTLPEKQNHLVFPKPQFTVRTQSVIQPQEEPPEAIQESKEFLMVSQAEGDVELLSYDFIPHRTNSVIYRQSKYPNASEDVMRKPYNKIMQGIEKQIKQNISPLHRFMKLYLDHFIKLGEPIQKYSVENDNLSSMQDQMRSKQLLVSQANITITNLKDFVYFFAVSTYYYYEISNLKEQSIYFTRDNLSFFSMNILFQHDKLYKIIFESISLANETENEMFEGNQQKYKHQRPGFFGVPQHLELLDDTLEEQKYSKESIEKEVFEEESDQSQDSKPLEWIISNISESYKKSQNNDSILEEEFPYQKSIKQLELLQKVKSPLHQLKIICSITELIQYSIKKFYNRHNQKLTKKLSAEDIIPITLYIIVRAKVPYFGTYLKIIENFTPKNTMNSYAGYRLVTMQNCYHIMQNFQNWQKMKESVLPTTLNSSDD